MSSEEALWYKDAIIYELHVRAFCDGIGDGMGDFRGLTQKLDYLQDLGVTAIWLLPFYPSPLRDDGYDIADYREIHPHYGSLEDFQQFLAAAHERGLRVITELVINHTSDQHAWFQRARRAPPGSPERDFYVWSETPEKYRDARIIFKDFEASNWTYDSVAKAYYWHRFYSHQPDLNFDNPHVWQALLPVVDFWFGMGVDGMRLDAVPYLYEREGTNCENLAETHGFLQALRSHVDEKFPHRMLLAEANQWPEDAVAYFGEGNECHMCFHFPVMPRLFMSIQMEDRFPIIDILDQTPAIPDLCQWALFLRNHDELTLEMVTDEERDYMYRAYAHDPRARINLGIRRRLAPLLGNNRRRIELMNGLLFSLPGTPVIYYGDEIGMGDNIYLGDRNGVRTPMQWSSDRNAGFSRSNPQKLFLPVIIDPEYHYESVNVEAQQNNSNSLLWWMKRLIALRKNYKAFGRGRLEFLQPDNRKILAFLRITEEQTILVVANLSRFVQYVELDLSRYAGSAPIELFGSNEFPRIGRLPYLLTLGPHSFYWFLLCPQEAELPCATLPGMATQQIGQLQVQGSWESFFQPVNLRRLAEILPQYIRRAPWHAEYERIIKDVSIREVFRMAWEDRAAYVVLADVAFNAGDPLTYALPMTYLAEPLSDELLESNPSAVVVRLGGDQPGVLYDALVAPGFCEFLMQSVVDGRRLAGSQEGELVAWKTADFSEREQQAEKPWHASLVSVELSNTSIRFGSTFLMKVFRRIEQGMHPELEMGLMLGESKRFPHMSKTLAAVEYRRRLQPVTTMAIIQEFIPNEGDAWQFTLDVLSEFYERVATLPEVPTIPRWTRLDELPLELPRQVEDLLGDYLELARLLALRTGEMHRALSSLDDPRFAPEPFTALYQRSIYQSMRSLKWEVFYQLRKRVETLPDSVRTDAERVLASGDAIVRRFSQLRSGRIESLRIRCHGDYHLGQLLYTGKDFVVIDFEGVPTESIGERQIKRSPLRDVVGMMRSFHYAAQSAWRGLSTGRGRPKGVIRAEDASRLSRWSLFWSRWVSASFLMEYLNSVGGEPFLPPTAQEREILLEAFLFERILEEIQNELVHRPEWLPIPLAGLTELLNLRGDAVT